MKTFFAVFSTPLPDVSPVFWGAFSELDEATNAVLEWVNSQPYWELEDFTISEHPFGVLL
jgi:hypothetical protein